MNINTAAHHVSSGHRAAPARIKPGADADATLRVNTLPCGRRVLQRRIQSLLAQSRAGAEGVLDAGGEAGAAAAAAAGVAAGAAAAAAAAGFVVLAWSAATGLPPSSARLRFLSPSFLKSVSYQPLPARRKDGAVSCRRSSDLPHCGQIVGSSADSFCNRSKLCPQAWQAKA